MRWELKNITGTCQAVLRVLARSTPCTLSREQIALNAGCSLDSVKRAIRKLHSDGWINVHHGGNGRGQRNCYELTEKGRTVVLMQKGFAR